MTHFSRDMIEWAITKKTEGGCGLGNKAAYR